MKIDRFPIVLSTGLSAFLLALAGVAWACTPQAKISLLPEAGGPGTPVVIEGKNFGASSSAPSSPTPIEIRWNSVDGPVLGTATGPTFSLSVNIPADAVGGTMSIVAVQHDASGATVQKASRTFTVEGPKGAHGGAAGDVWSGLSRGRSAGSPDTAVATTERGRYDGALGMAVAMAGALMLTGWIFLTKGRRRQRI